MIILFISFRFVYTQSNMQTNCELEAEGGKPTRQIFAL